MAASQSAFDGQKYTVGVGDGTDVASEDLRLRQANWEVTCLSFSDSSLQHKASLSHSNAASSFTDII